MRAHLINPPAHQGVDMVREGRCMQRAGAWTAVWPPISLATIAAVLEADDVDVRLDDCIIEKVSKQGLLQRARDFGADLFVINTATPSIDSDLALADDLRREFPQAIIAAIGIHVTALPEDSLTAAPGLDVIIRGEPELTARELARAQRDGNPIAGLAGTTVKNGDEIITGPDAQMADLDELPPPAWDHVKRELYCMPFTDHPFLLIGTSRGCPFHCRFCADPTYYGHKLRTKSPGRIVAELRTARERWGVRDFLFWSESFTLKRDWTMEVLDAIIDADLDLRFVVNSRSDHVDPELLARLKKAGAWMIGYGIESGSQRVLDLMNKNIKVADNLNALARAREAGLKTTAHMVLGYPGETVETIKQTIDFACAAPLDYAQFYCASAFPGSELYQKARDAGWIEAGAPWERFEQNYALISTPELSATEVMAWRGRAYRRFYSRPGRIYRVLRDEVGVRGAPRFARMALSFLGWV